MAMNRDNILEYILRSEEDEDVTPKPELPSFDSASMMRDILLRQQDAQQPSPDLLDVPREEQPLTDIESQQFAFESNPQQELPDTVGFLDALKQNLDSINSQDVTDFLTGSPAGYLGEKIGEEVYDAVNNTDDWLKSLQDIPSELTYMATDTSLEPYISDEDRANLPFDDPNRDAVSPVMVGDWLAAIATKLAPVYGRQVLKNAPEIADTVTKKLTGDLTGMKPTLGIDAYHGSPHKFDEFSLENIGSGEGAQAYGHGLYFAESQGVAGSYQKAIPHAQVRKDFLKVLPEDAEFDEVMKLVGSGKFSEGQERVLKALEEDDWLGFDYPSQAISSAYKDLDRFDPSPELRDAVAEVSHMYKVDIRDDDVDSFLDWDKPLSDQLEKIPESMFETIGLHASDKNATGGRLDYVKEKVAMTGGQLYNRIVGESGGQAQASEIFNKLGVKGIRYLDATSRKAGEGTSNLVVFDDAIVTTKTRNGEVVKPKQEGVDYESETRGLSGISELATRGKSAVAGRADTPAPSARVTRADKDSTLRGIRERSTGTTGKSASPAFGHAGDTPLPVRIGDTPANVTKVHQSTPEVAKDFDAIGVTNEPWHELEAGMDSSIAFNKAITQAKASLGKGGASVYVYPPEDLVDAKMFTTADGMSGFAIKPDGDIVSVFSASPRKGSATSALQLAVENGGTKLDAFDTYLPEIYRRSGFKEVGRDPWSDEDAPDDWDADTFGAFNGGKPDVVYMEYQPAKAKAKPPRKSKTIKGGTTVKHSSREEAEAQGYWHPIGEGKKLKKPVPEFRSEKTELDIEPSRIITPEELFGEFIIPASGDRTSAGKILTSVGGHEFRDPIRLEGGMGYMRDNPEGIWASGKGVVSKLMSAAKPALDAGEAVNMVYLPMLHKSTNFSTMMTDALFEQIVSGDVSKTAMNLFDRELRKLRPEWKGLNSPDAMAQLHSVGDLRHQFAKTANLENFQKRGFPDLAETRYAITDESLLDVPLHHGGQSIGRMSGETVQNPVQPHKSYESVIGGDYVGGFADAVPRDILFPEFYNTRRLEGKPESSDYRAFSMMKVLQKADQKWLDGIMDYLKTAEK